MSDELTPADAARILSDLDRCEHGRHRGDVCGGIDGCNGPSRGNPYLEADNRIGTTMTGKPIMLPTEGHAGRRHTLSAWLPEGAR